MEEFLKVVQCPYCQGEIKIIGDGWRCFNCSKEWLIDSDDITRLREDNVFFGNNRKEMNDLLSEIRKISTWEKFEEKISEFEKKYSDFNYDYCLNPKRADFTFLGDFEQKIVVDLGAGYGSIAIPLAKRAKVVIALEACLERIKFLSLVAKLRNINNIIPIHGEVIKLPLKEETVDRFIMIGLLEYFSNRQEGFLKYLYQFLKPKGEVWVGIENRLSPIHFLGKTYHSEEFPFEPLLPRFVAAFIRRIIKNAPLKTALHTKKGYFHLFRKAGFKNIEFFYAFPNYKNQKFITSNAKFKMVSAFLKRRRWGKGKYKISLAIKIIELLDKMGLLGVFAPSFFIKAKKDNF